MSVWIRVSWNRVRSGGVTLLESRQPVASRFLAVWRGRVHSVRRNQGEHVALSCLGRYSRGRTACGTFSLNREKVDILNCRPSTPEQITGCISHSCSLPNDRNHNDPGIRQMERPLSVQRWNVPMRPRNCSVDAANIPHKENCGQKARILDAAVSLRTSADRKVCLWNPLRK